MCSKEIDPSIGIDHQTELRTILAAIDDPALSSTSVVNQSVPDDPACASPDIPEANPDVDIPGEAYGVLHRLAGKWTDVLDKQNLILKPLKGAMTNHVYECQWPQQDHENPRKVLVRVYGEGCELFFSREVEIRTFERMSLLGQGPRLLARFPNGRVEEFLNARTLQADDLRNPTISARIAAKLSEFHKLDMPGPPTPQLWERLRFWVGKALEICSPIQHEEFHLHSMRDEISELEYKLSSQRERTGFCHNDLQYGNIMMDETDGSVTIIDYEYASFNPVAFDIANHFCEMTADYHSELPHILDYSKYPGYAERLQFIQAYLKTSGTRKGHTTLLYKEAVGNI